MTTAVNTAALGVSGRSVHVAVHPDRHGQAEENEDDAYYYRRPAEQQARERQAGSPFAGALDLASRYVAEHDRRDGRQRSESDLREPAGKAGYREPVGLDHWDHRGRRRNRQDHAKGRV